MKNADFIFLSGNTRRLSSFLFTGLVMAVLLFLPGCSNNSSNDTTTIGNWSRVSPFKGRPRSGAIVFTIGTKAFVGLGHDGQQYITDFYSYDINQGFWETKTTFPGKGRERAVAFSVNGKGYVGLGYNRDNTVGNEELADFWEYNPDTNAWTQLKDFKGTARYNAVAFALGGKGYVGTGYDGVSWNSDFWQYDASSDSWQEIQSYPGEKIEGGVAFVLGDKAYVCGGRNNGLHNTDFWEFASDMSWTKKSPATDDASYAEFKLAVQRHDAMVLTMGGKAYIVGGIAASGAVDKTVHEFDPATYAWTKRTAFEGSARSLAVAFVLNDRGFIGTGQNGSSHYDDVWEFKPTEAYDENN